MCVRRELTLGVILSTVLLTGGVKGNNLVAEDVTSVCNIRRDRDADSGVVGSL